jgi:uncharacterized protein (TIGR02145 family)
MKRIFTLFFMLTLLFSAFSQQSNCPPTVTDRNGNVYNTVWVGGNCWMKENLRSTLYGTQSNADHLQPVYMVYPNTAPGMGYLYTWYSAVGLPQGSNATPPTAISERVQGICPNEWAIPSAIQLMSLINSGEPREGNTPTYWVYNNGIMPAGTNLFNMVPSGFYNSHLERFVEYNHAGYLWTLNYNGTTSTCGIFPFDCRQPDQMSMNKNSLLSVRCVKAPPYGVEEITTCDSITWNGVTRYTTGRYVANLPNDSVSTLLLTVNYTTYYTLKVLACDSYTWDLSGDTYITTGTDVAVIQNALGCDSVVTLDLEVRYSNTGVDVQNHCDSYQWIDGITYTESTNEPTFVVTNAAGCDSTVTLNLTIRKMTTGIDVQNHCDSYTWIDGHTYTESTNEPTFVLTNAVGCDSVVTLNLTIRKKTYGIDVQDHCDTYTWMNGVTYTESTDTPVHTITNMAGCDSIVTLNLTIRKQTSSSTQSLTEYNTYTWNGSTYTTSGIYTATLTNAAGCDSTATLDLTILYRFPITYNLNGGAIGPNDPITYVQGVGTTLPIPVKVGNRFEGWFDNAGFTGTPITQIGNTESGDRQYWALWTVETMAKNSFLSFPGNANSYAQIPDSTYLNPTTAVTLEAWIYPTAWRSESYQGSIIAKEQSTGNGGYVLRCGSSGTLNFAVGIGSGFQEVTSTGLTLNQWQHVAGVYDGATLKIYRNGVLLNTKTQTGTINVSSNPIEIGRNNQYTDRYFTGNIDEVRIFNVALNAATIQSWYNKTVNNTHANYANLVGYYEFDNTTIPTTTNGTIGANGTIAGATYGSGCNFTFESNSSVIGAPTVLDVTHPTKAIVMRGNNDIKILKINVSTAITSSLTQITFSTTGTTNVADITNARLYYTGSSNTFSTSTMYGTVVANPNGTFTFTGNQPLVCGTNVFWLTYDISSTATYTNVVDAAVVNATVERLVVTPINGAPAGNRRIADACIHTLQIRDTYGDTWNGGTVSLFVNGNPVYENITVSASVTTFFDFPFGAELGDTIRVIRTNDGSYPGEMRVQILGGNGLPVILAEIQPTVAPGLFTIGGCYIPVTSSTNSFGTISPSGINGVLLGGTRKFTLTPNTNCWLDSIIVDNINIIDSIPGKSYTFYNVTAPRTIRAVFNANVITATASANGTISSSGVTVMAPNSSKTYTMTPSTNYFLDSLIVDGFNRPDSITLKRFTFNNVNEDHTIYAVFRTNTITSSTGANGTISPLGITNKDKNTTQKFTITPNQYYYLDSLIVDGINRPDSIAGKSFTFTNINENHTIRVVFKTNYLTPVLVTPPTLTGTPVQDAALSTTTLTGGLMQYNSTEVPGTFAWTAPSSLFTLPGNYNVTFTPTDTVTYFRVKFDIPATFNITYLLAANGTATSSYIPFEGYNLDGAQHNQMIYPASMLTAMVGRQITSITFYLSSPPAVAWTAVSTYKIGTTTTSTLSGLITNPSNTVYTGLMPVVSNTVTITFTTPYTYTGDNLIIDFSNVAGNWKSATFYGVTQTSASYYTRGTTLTSYSFLPKVRFNVAP